ncbi:MAG TPA: hypothetical protein VF491_04095 [Vicinamibacterales bacterium]|jgi:hypothetical protein
MAIDGMPSVDNEQLPPWLIVLVASSDGIKAIGRIVSVLPRDLAAAPRG